MAKTMYLNKRWKKLIWIGRKRAGIEQFKFLFSMIYNYVRLIKNCLYVEVEAEACLYQKVISGTRLFQ